MPKELQVLQWTLVLTSSRAQKFSACLNPASCPDVRPDPIPNRQHDTVLTPAPFSRSEEEIANSPCHRYSRSVLLRSGPYDATVLRSCHLPADSLVKVTLPSEHTPVQLSFNSSAAGQPRTVLTLRVMPVCQVARRHADEYCMRQLGYSASNMRFVEGHIEYLDAAGIADESVRPHLHPRTFAGVPPSLYL